MSEQNKHEHTQFLLLSLQVRAWMIIIAICACECENEVIKTPIKIIVHFVHEFKKGVCLGRAVKLQGMFQP